MIPDVLLIISSTVVLGVAKVFGLINFVLPVQISTSITYFISYLGYITDFVPVSTLMSAIGVFLIFEFYWYIFKLALWIFALTPWFGKHVPFFRNDHKK